MALMGGPVPLYFQIQQHLREQILAGEFGPGAPLPTEAELCNQFGVSRITVGKALDALVADQLIQRRRGVGTFVAERPGLAKSVRLTGWLDEMLAPGASFELLDAGFASPPPDVLEALSLAPPVYCFKATNSSPSGVFSYSKLYVAGPLGKRIDAARRSDEQPTIRIIERIMSSRVERAEQTVVPVLAAGATAERLGLQRGVPILEVMRRYFMSSDKPIAIAKAWYHPERFRYAIELYPRPTSRGGNGNSDA